MKEEQKEHLINIMKADEEIGLYDIFNKEKIESIKEMIDRHNQERLEEAADLWSIDINNVHPADSYIAKQGFISGAKWQIERMYSEEDMMDYSNYRLLIKKALSPKEWFEQIKNK